MQLFLIATFILPIFKSTNAFLQSTNLDVESNNDYSMKQKISEMIDTDAKYCIPVQELLENVVSYGSISQTDSNITSRGFYEFHNIRIKKNLFDEKLHTNLYYKPSKGKNMSFSNTSGLTGKLAEINCTARPEVKAQTKQKETYKLKNGKIFHRQKRNVLHQFIIFAISNKVNDRTNETCGNTPTNPCL